MSLPLVEVTRGGTVESRHSGMLAIADARGRLILALGDVERPVFPRSAVKAFQALPLIESGAADRFGLTDAELALALASHSGEPMHVDAASSMLAKAGRDVACLECGAHWPNGERAARALAASGKPPSALHNNCSGKHAGFVCFAIHEGIDPVGYVGQDHPVQARLRQSLHAMTGIDPERGPVGIDGCSIPTYAAPLSALAAGFARFGTGEGLGADRALAAKRLRRAAAAHPEMVSGTGRFDTRIMAALGGRAFVKTGAEGVYCAALPELGLGVALKIEDGGTRAAQVAMASVLLTLLPDAGVVVSEAAAPALTNWNGIAIGDIRASAEFSRALGTIVRSVD